MVALPVGKAHGIYLKALGFSRWRSTSRSQCRRSEEQLLFYSFLFFPRIISPDDFVELKTKPYRNIGFNDQSARSFGLRTLVFGEKLTIPVLEQVF